ncbi:MAG TPA: hypothetical protein VMA96_17685 [Solirubrobacteraceae bacterium]|nr:hypothetical protein [Solirubrobacteraceae bacterium]
MSRCSSTNGVSNVVGERSALHEHAITPLAAARRVADERLSVAGRGSLERGRV